MTQSDINNAVSRALGEDLRHISQRGFSLIDLGNDDFDPDCDCLDPQVIDFDAPYAGTTQSFHELF